MNDPNINVICCGLYHTMIYKLSNFTLKSDNYSEHLGDLFIVGSNYHGELGLNNIIYEYYPTLLFNNINIKTLSCGGYHSIIHTNNNISCFGYNYRGQLYLNEYKDKENPILIPLNANEIRMISSHLSNSIIYKNNGDLFNFYFNKINNTVIIMNDPSIIKIDNQSILFEW